MRPRRPPMPMGSDQILYGTPPTFGVPPRWPGGEVPDTGAPTPPASPTDWAEEQAAAAALREIRMHLAAVGDMGGTVSALQTLEVGARSEGREAEARLLGVLGERVRLVAAVLALVAQVPS